MWHLSSLSKLKQASVKWYYKITKVNNTINLQAVLGIASNSESRLNLIISKQTNCIEIIFGIVWQRNAAAMAD